MGFFTSYKMKKIAKKKKELAYKKRALAYLEDPDVILAANRTSQPTADLAWYLSRFTEEQARRIIKAYLNQPSLKDKNITERISGGMPLVYYDPIEDDPEIKRMIDAAHVKAEKKYPKDELGRCVYIWHFMEQVLQQQGIDWISPAFMNPYVRFD